MTRGRPGGAAGEAWLGTQEVARLLGVSTARIRQLALAGELPEAQRIGGRRVFRRADVEAYRKQRGRPSGSVPLEPHGKRR